MFKALGHLERTCKLKLKQDIEIHVITTNLQNYAASNSNPKDIYASGLGYTPNSDYHDRFYVVKIDQPTSIQLSFHNISVSNNKTVVLYSLNIIHNLQATNPKTFFSKIKNQNTFISSHNSL